MKCFGRFKRKRMQWYGVKLLYQSIISGEPSPETIDENYTDTLRWYEESIILVKAFSFNNAYDIAEKHAKDCEYDYHNPYDEFVEFKFVRSIDCFILIDEVLRNCTEVYSRFISVPNDMSTDQVLSRFYPETEEWSEDDPDYRWIMRDRDFNQRPSSKK